MCQLGSNIACSTIDRAEHIAHGTVILRQDVVTSLLSVSMCHTSSWMHGLICSTGNVIVFSTFGAIALSSLILEVKLIEDL